MCIRDSNGIVTLYDVYETDSSICLILKLLTKGELFDWMMSNKLNESQVRSLMREILQSVCYLHSLNIIHRDIKAENILLDDKLHPHLSDFGLATKTNDTMYHYEVYGTPSYMAPEMVQCAVDHDHVGYGKPVDLWSCGVLMYQLIFGRRPFDHRKQLIMLRSIRNADYSFPYTEWNHISESAKDLIRKLLVVNPSNRLTAKQALQHTFFNEGEIM